MPDSRSHQVWLNSIPLGSLDQLQEAVKSPPLPEQRYLDPATVELPQSGEASLIDAPTSSVHNGQGPVQRARVIPGSSEPRRAQEAESQARAGADRPDSMYDLTSKSASVRSLINASQVLLPSSGASSIGQQPQMVNSPGSGSALAANAGPENDGQQMILVDRSAVYWRTIAPLASCLPHIQAIFGPQHGRHQTVGAVTCIDYLRDSHIPRVGDSFTPSQFQDMRVPLQRVRSLRDDAGPEVVKRVILCEDLCSQLIESLGSTFKIDPEFFAEHLNRSGYEKADYDDPLPSRWGTHTLPKCHASVNWFRPIQQNPKVTEWMRNSKTMLNKRRLLMKGRKKVVMNSVSWLDPEYTAAGRLNEDRMRHETVVQTNIVRQNWPLSTRPLTSAPTPRVHRMESQDYETQTQSGSIGETASVHSVRSEFRRAARQTKLIPTAWVEKASFYMYSEGSTPIVILLLDPLPAISDVQKPAARRRVKAGQVQSAQHGSFTTPVEMGLPLAPRIPSALPRNKFEATGVEIAQFSQSVTALTSTADAIRFQVEQASLRAFNTLATDPLVALLRVIQVDFKAFCQGLEWALDEISQDSLDDYLMTRRAADWRKLMSDLEIEIPTNGKSLEAFVSFISQNNGGSAVPAEYQEILTDIKADIAHASLKLKEAYASLRSDMQFTESRKSISEAKAVAKLTELAFIFIPLSFAASLFSMSIQELQDGVPVWTFVATALGLAVLSYGLRLVIASDFIADRSRGALEKFWTRRNVRRGDSAPIVTLVILTAQEIWRNGGASVASGTAVFLFIATFIVVPVAFMWTSTRLDTGFNVAMTLLFLLSGFGIAFMFTLTDSDIAAKIGFWWNPHSGYDSDGSSEDV